MKLILELTDDQIVALRETLRVRLVDMKNINSNGKPPGSNWELDYAYRILWARRILGMGNSFNESGEGNDLVP